MTDEGGALETKSIAGALAPRGDAAGHLFVIEDGSSRIVPLDDTGIITIGRAPEAELRLDHASVSRRHARIVVERGEVRITDLDSHNGTRVNGATLEGSRVLTTGDVVAIGEVIVIVHADPARRAPQVVLDEPSWRRRLAEEVERAVLFRRSLCVLAVIDAGRERFASGALRPIDVVGATADGILALLPEADPRIARELAGTALHALRATAPSARAGIASCPSDVTDADSLVMAARAAAHAATAGGIATLAETVARHDLDGRVVVVCHPAMVRVYDLLRRLAASELPVLVVGENGVGKEHAAYAVHYHSARRGGPFVAVDCASIPEGLAESQLFGHDRGAFTGASAARPGVFETASGGTLFLDELGELAPPIQAKLLRALEARRIVRVGETAEREVDVRVVAATNRDLEAEVATGRFRKDLYFRIGGARVYVPPLRERRCEIPILFRDLVARAAERAGREPPEPTPLAVQRLLAHAWPGNVRELRNVAEFVVATVDDERIEHDDLPDDLARPPAVPPPTPAPRGETPAPMRRVEAELEELERRRMMEAMERTGGVKIRAAALIGMPIRTFNKKFRDYGL